MIARLYESDKNAKAAVSALKKVGIDSDNIALLANPAAAKAAAGDAAGGKGGEGGEAGAAAPAGADPAAMATAVRAGRMLGSRADFYLSRLDAGRTLVVSTPHVMMSATAEKILDAHHPLPINHEPEREEFVPISEQATPFSNWLGMPVLTDSATPFSDLLGFGFKQEGVSHLSRWFKPLAPGYTFSSLLGMGFSTSSATPLSSKLGMSTRSSRNEGKESSFGMKFKTKSATPFSSLLGLPVLTKRKHFLYS